MQVNCLHCGHKFDLGKNYDDYEGLVRCSTCAGLLDIRTQEGDVKAVRFGVVPTAAAPAPASQAAPAAQSAPPVVETPTAPNQAPSGRQFHPFQGFGGPARPSQGSGEREVA